MQDGRNDKMIPNANSSAKQFRIFRETENVTVDQFPSSLVGQKSGVSEAIYARNRCSRRTSSSSMASSSISMYLEKSFFKMRSKMIVRNAVNNKTSTKELMMDSQ